MKQEFLHIASSLWATVAAQISRHTGQTFAPESLTPIGGGCINQTFCIRDHERQYFVKLNKAGNLAMFESEAAGLGEMSLNHFAAEVITMMPGWYWNSSIFRTGEMQLH